LKLYAAREQKRLNTGSGHFRLMIGIYSKQFFSSGILLYHEQHKDSLRQDLDYKRTFPLKFKKSLTVTGFFTRDYVLHQTK
jgi:hypothetical protein